MRVAVINQYPEVGATGARLQQLISEFAREPEAQFRCLVAFASEGGLKQLEDEALRFLEQGRSIYFIVGVDLEGTSREAVERMLSWKRAFPKQVDARVFTTGDNATIFHPKVYWFDSPERRVVVVGSANATRGGLGSNFEVSVEMEFDSESDSDALEDFDFLWMTYSSPLPPLSEENLREVDKSLAARLQSSRAPTDGHPAQPHPLAEVKRVTPTGEKQRARPKEPTLASPVELIMDILQETRQTQVQLPVSVLEPFFRTKPKQRQSIELRQVFRGEVVKSNLRPFIHLRHNDTHRLEIDAIRGQPRPMIIRFWRTRDDARVIYYEIAQQKGKKYQALDALLREEGTQTRAGARRFVLRGVSGKRLSSRRRPSR